MDTLTRTIVVVLIFDFIVLFLVVVLFKLLASRATATATGSGSGIHKWKATARGGLAGFIILSVIQLLFIRYFYQKEFENRPDNHPSSASVLSFYRSIQQRNYSNAWNFLSPEMKSRCWQNKEEDFYRGYNNTEEVNLLAVNFVSQKSPYSEEYVVYYQDKTDAPVLAGFERLSEMKVQNLPQLCSNVFSLRASLLSRGISASTLDDMSMAELTTAIRGDILYWKIEKTTSPAVAEAFLPTKKIVSRLVGCRVIAHLYGNDWFVDDILHIPYNDEAP